MVLGDEPRAFKARALRDELRAAAAKAHADISEQFVLRSDPLWSGRKWALHHERTFKDVVYAYDNRDLAHSNYYKYSSATRNAAWDWHYGTERAAHCTRELSHVSSEESVD